MAAQTAHLDGMPRTPCISTASARAASPARWTPRCAAAGSQRRRGGYLAARAFKARDAIRTWWALTAGVPSPADGRIDAALMKRGSAGGERVVVDVAGKPARTDYVVEGGGTGRLWVAHWEPLTGRAHQLRAHMAALGTPILGDGKYGGAKAFVPGVAQRLHLHARTILPRPDGRALGNAP